MLWVYRAGKLERATDGLRSYGCPRFTFHPPIYISLLHGASGAMLLQKHKNRDLPTRVGVLTFTAQIHEMQGASCS